MSAGESQTISISLKRPPGASVLLLAPLSALLLAAAYAVRLTPLGPLAGHMSSHIIAMNLAAPALAFALHRWAAARGPARPAQGLAAATAVQILALWLWHAPRVFAWSMASPLLTALMHITLYAAALWFWSAVFAVSGEGRWRPILALLISGKLFCLLGAVLVFAPRVLLGGGTDEVALADQHLAGLLMLSACPATFVLAGVVLSAKWVFELEAPGGARSGL
jgi:putative membrane protein